MPRIHALGVNKDWYASQRGDAALVSAIGAYKEVNRIQSGELARSLGMSDSTFRRKMHDPSTFTLKDIRSLRGLMARAGQPIDIGMEIFG